MKTRASSSKVQAAPDLYDFAVDQSPSAWQLLRDFYVSPEIYVVYFTRKTRALNRERYVTVILHLKKDAKILVVIFAAVEKGCDETPLRVVISFKAEDFSY